MIKKYLKIALILIIAINITGCAELRRKFVRKKKPRSEEYSFYRVEEYRPKPPHERYQEHFVLWHNWHLDLARTEGTSHLRDLRAANEVMKHLTAMRDLLEEEKAKELDVQIEQMEELVAKLKKTRKDIIKDIRGRKTVEKVERIIINNFTYTRMQDYIKSEE